MDSNNIRLIPRKHKGDFNHLATVDPQTGVIAWIEQEWNGTLKSDGLITKICDKYYYLFVSDESLYFGAGAKIFQLDIDTRATLKPIKFTLGRFAVFSLYQMDRLVYRKFYFRPIALLFTESVSWGRGHEYYDFFLFVNNVVNDGERRNTIFRWEW